MTDCNFLIRKWKHDSGGIRVTGILDQTLLRYTYGSSGTNCFSSTLFNSIRIKLITENTAPFPLLSV